MSFSNREIRMVAHEVKRRALIVKRVEDLSPRLRKITFTGDQLADFVTLSPDDHVKVILSNGEMRDYTPLRYDPQTRELDLAFVLHGRGPASQWAADVQIGDRLNIGGPRGSKIVPYAFDGYLMLGDETAVPSFMRRLSELPKDAPALALIQIEDPSARIAIPHNGHAEIHWILRAGGLREQVGTFKEKLTESSLPPGDCFAWIAGEKSWAMDLQEFLVATGRLRSEWIKAKGYWRSSR